MIAKIRIAKNRRRPICSRGIIAFMIDFRTTCKPVETQRGPSVSERPAKCLALSPVWGWQRGRRSKSPRKGLFSYKTLKIFIIYFEEF